MAKSIYFISILFFLFSCSKRDPFYDACAKFEPVQLSVGDTIKFSICGDFKPSNGIFYKAYLPLYALPNEGSLVYFNNDEAIGVVADTGFYNFSIIEFRPKNQDPKIKKIGSFEVIL